MIVVRRGRILGLLAAVAVASADASLVVLALPAMLRQFRVSIVAVSWVITSFNVALALSALAYLSVGAARDSRRVALTGAGAFGLASLGCGVAPSFAVLLALRSLQGIAAAALLLGSLPLLRGLAGSSRGIALWTGAGVAGAAIGPAVGGALTDAFGWRTIFVAQAPAALSGLVLRSTLGRKVCLSVGPRYGSGSLSFSPRPESSRCCSSPSSS
jgi:MFS family permease